MIDRKWIGHEVGNSTLHVERTRLKFFAKAIGESNPIYLDEVAATAAGYADIPAPPTFIFAAELDSNAMFSLFSLLGIKLQNVLHGQQKFEYAYPIVAGDTITVSSHVKDIYEKRSGALEFLETESIAVNQNGALVAKMSSLIVVRS
jgi:acyl dehydratase